MDFSSNRRLRRATSDFNNLSIAPLTAKFPLDLDEDDEYVDANPNNLQNSYIEGRSAPTTPRILSRNPSFSQLRLSQAHLPKSKSSSQLAQKPERRTAHKHGGSAEWFTRAGAAISSDARETKGQSWLISRASSTGLVNYSGSEELLSSYADEEYGTPSRRTSRPTSQNASRVQSRSGSRHGSRSGPRPDIYMSGTTTPRKIRSNSGIAREREDYFQQNLQSLSDIDTEVVIFSDDDDAFEDEITDSEVSQMVRQRGFGFGRWVDSLMEWSLFAVDEEPEPVEQERGKRSIEHEHARTESVEEQVDDTFDPLREGPLEEDALWQDATWFLSVLGKILL